MRAGALALAGGCSLSTLLAAEKHNQRVGKTPGKAKNVIVLYLLGGAATQDMVDMKPNAPAEVRGEFKPIESSLPGLQVCEHLPRLAKWAHKMAIVRSVNHKAGCHNPLPSYTGFEQTLSDIGSTRPYYPPSMGSICEYLKPPSTPMPAYMYLPCYLGWGQVIRRPGPYAGFLGAKYDALYSEVTPYIDADAPKEEPGMPQVCRGIPRLPEGATGEGITLDRFHQRRDLLAQFDDQVRQVDASSEHATYDRNHERAYDLMTSAKVRAAFNLESEDPRLVDRYGRSLFGNSALIARKLVEAGVRFVNVTWDIYWDRYQIQYDGWDTHTRNFAIMKDYNLPYFDMAFSALMEDLETRGLLDETLVVVLSEMGRTPKINANAGRDHWTYCYSNMFAGAGIRAGTVYGASDAQAGFVKDSPVSTGDICATIYQSLGIDPAMTVLDRTNRPMPIANGGVPIAGILA